MATTFLTTRDLQDLIRVDKSTIYRMAEDGRLPALKVGRQWRFPADEIEAWLAGGAVRGAGNGLEVASDARLQDLADLMAAGVDAMVVITDFSGVPLTEVANPCGLFTALAGEPEVMPRCLEAWSSYGDHPELVPRFHRSLFGFLCARAFVRVGDRLAAMVIAGGLATADWPPAATEVDRIASDLDAPVDLVKHHIAEVHPGGDDKQQRILEALPRAARLVSSLLEGERSGS